MKYCIEDNYNDLLNLFFGIQKKQAAGTVYMLLQNELYIIDTELIACSDKILINFKVSEDQKKKTENFKTYVCILSKSNFDNGVFKINIENNEDTSVELEIIQLLTEKLYGHNTIRDAKGF
jgi:hypothetical protein